MNDDALRESLPASIDAYAREYPAATPATIMDALALDERFRTQIAYCCAVTRYSFDAEANDCEKAEDLRIQTVEWADVADWEVPAEDRPAEE